MAFKEALNNSHAPLADAARQRADRPQRFVGERVFPTLDRAAPAPEGAAWRRSGRAAFAVNGRGPLQERQRRPERRRVAQRPVGIMQRSLKKTRNPAGDVRTDRSWWAPCRRAAALRLLLLIAMLWPAIGLAADPTAPPASVHDGANAGRAESVPLPVVRAVIDSGDRRLAVVDGRLLREGERTDYGQVERIERSAVIFSRDGRRVRVSTVASVRGGQ